jgi:hypothetical protein
VRDIGTEMLKATFAGCDFHVRGGMEMTVELPEGSFTGVVSGFNIERISRTEIETNITIVRSSTWERLRTVFGPASTQGEIRS